MKVILFSVLAVILAVVVIVSCTKNDNNPLDSDSETGTITGFVYQCVGGNGISGVSIHIEGSDTDETILSDSDGIYALNDISFGDYTVSVSDEHFMFRPKEQHISVRDGIVIMNEFYGFPIPLLGYKENDYHITGKVVDGENNPVNNVEMHIEGLDSQRKTKVNGYFLIPFLEKGKTYTITPEKAGYDYVFSPANCIVTINDRLSVCTFIAKYTGTPLYSISGKVVSFEGEGLDASVTLESSDQQILRYQTGTSGEYSFIGHKPGLYTVRFFSHRGTIENEDIEITILDKDIVIPDVRAYNDSTYCTVTGKILTDEGAALDSIRVNINTKDYWDEHIYTDSSGHFRFDDALKVQSKRTYSIIPVKEGYSFSPDSAFVQLSWIPWEKEADAITMPDFIGHDFKYTSNADFFPLTTNTYWTYSRNSSGSGVSDHTVTITGRTNNDGATYYQMSGKTAWGFTDFRLDGNDIYTFYGNEAFLFLQFGVIPGTEWKCGLEAGVYTRTGTFLGTKTVQAPAGTFENCAHFESKITYSDDMYDSYDLWYASEVGLVKSVKIIMDNGDMIEHVTDILTSYSIP